MTDYRVEWVQIGGRSIPAELIICPQCKALDLHTDFDTSELPWKAVCSRGHEFTVNPEPNA